MRPALILSCLLVGLGCFATSSQVQLLREFLVVFSGNEVCLATVFACWFLGIMLGAALGGPVGSRLKEPCARQTGLLVVAGLSIVMLIAALTVCRHWRTLFAVQAGQIPGMGLLLSSCLLLVTPFSTLIGLTFPLACQAAPQNDNRIVGWVYVIESGGAILGGWAASFLMALRLHPLESLGLTTLPLLAGMTAVGILQPHRRLTKVLGATFGAVMLLIAAMLATGAIGALDQRMAAQRFESLGTGNRLVSSCDTPYQHLDLAEQGGQYTLYGNGKFVTNFPDPYRARARAHLILNQHPGPRNMLLLGVASVDMIPIALLYPLERLDVVELDGEVLGLIRPYLDPALVSALSGSRVRFHNTDARRFLQQNHDPYDLIFSDAPDPSTAAENRMFTSEFFEQIQARLSEQGVFITRLSSSATVLDQDAKTQLATMLATLRQTFSYVQLLPGTETFLLSARHPGLFVSDPKDLAQRYNRANIQDNDFSPFQFSVMFEASQVADLWAQLADTPVGSINKDEQPFSYLQSIMRWSRMTDDGTSGMLRGVLAVPPWVWFALLAALGGFFIWRAGRKSASAASATRIGALFAIAAIGMTGLSLELMVSLAYQSFFGSLYQEMGGVVATFMAGLVGGGLWMQRRLRRKQATSRFLFLLLWCQSLSIACLPWMLSSGLLERLPLLLGQLLIFLVLFLVGCGTGLVFPSSSQLLLQTGGSLVKNSAKLDALDHFGAAIGAFFTGVVLLPVLGRTLSCMLLALLLLFASIINFLAHLRGHTRRQCRHKKLPSVDPRQQSVEECSPVK